MNCFELIFSTQNRLRFRFCGYLVNENLLLEKLSEYGECKISLNAKSLSINSKNIIEKLDKIKNILNEIQTSTKLNEQKLTPSKKQIYSSFLGLGASLILPKNSIALKTISAFSCFDIIKEGFLELKTQGITSKVLEAAAVFVSFMRNDFIAANGTNTMLSIGEYIEELTSFKSDDLIKSLAKPQITDVWIEDKKTLKLKRIKSTALKVGDIIVVGAGDTIQADGYVVEGTASVNQVSITGEAEPIKKEESDKVLSGSVVIDGRIKVWAQKVGKDSTQACIQTYIQESLKEKSSVGQKAYKMADKLVPVTLGLGGVSYLFSANTRNLASVLQADYSCALKLATPVAFKSAIAKSGKNGILFKGSKTLEMLANVDTFVFDKTGTLTKGELKVKEVISFDENISSKMLLNLTASAEEHYFHPVAKAIVNAANERGFSHINHDEVEFIVAHGVKTKMDNTEVIIGSRHFLEDDEGVDFSEYKALPSSLLNTLLYIAKDKKLLGVIVLKDELRKEAKECIDALRNLGVKKIVMLTGDIQSRADEIGEKLGLDEVWGDLLPTDKAKIVERLKQNGNCVAFVGDGINDAPSLSKADIGFCMQKGADIAKVTADIRLLKDDILAIVDAKDNANKTMRVINKNFKATVLINSAILLGATFGYLSPLKSALMHNGTTILLLLNALKRKSLF